MTKELLRIALAERGVAMRAAPTRGADMALREERAALERATLKMEAIAAVKWDGGGECDGRCHLSQRRFDQREKRAKNVLVEPGNAKTTYRLLLIAGEVRDKWQMRR